LWKEGILYEDVRWNEREGKEGILKQFEYIIVGIFEINWWEIFESRISDFISIQTHVQRLMCPYEINTWCWP
jgi:hypothetical protein